MPNRRNTELGASTTALVLQQQRNLAIADNNLISATAVYAKDRVALGQLLSSLLDKYNINIVDAATGNITHPLAIPGLTAPKPRETPQPLSTAPAAPPQ